MVPACHLELNRSRFHIWKMAIVGTESTSCLIVVHTNSRDFPPSSLLQNTVPVGQVVRMNVHA